MEGGTQLLGADKKDTRVSPRISPIVWCWADGYLILVTPRAQGCSWAPTSGSEVFRALGDNASDDVSFPLPLFRSQCASAVSSLLTERPAPVSPLLHITS